MERNWLSHPWIEKFLPDHLRPVDDHIFSDAHGTEIIQEIENALDRLIEYGQQVKGAQTFKRNGKTFQFRLKINQKRMRLLSYETARSEAAIKKRIIIDYKRKSYDPKDNSKRFKEATVQYIKNGQTYVRSIQKSALFQNVFQKMEQLDDALLGKLIKEPTPIKTTNHSPSPSDEKQIVEASEEPCQYLRAVEEAMKNHWSSLEDMIQSRLQRLIEEAYRINTIYLDLDVEEKYTFKRMLQKDIPSLVNTYLSLNEEQKKQKTEPLYESLIKMELSLRSMREKTEHEKTEKMEQLLKLNEKRYAPRSRRANR